MKKLKVGKTVKAAWRIYRDRFREYYRIAFFNSLVAGNSETIVEAKRHIKAKILLFFGAGLMGSVVFLFRLLLWWFLWLPLVMTVSTLFFGLLYIISNFYLSYLVLKI